MKKLTNFREKKRGEWELFYYHEELKKKVVLRNFIRR